MSKRIKSIMLVRKWKEAVEENLRKKEIKKC